MKYHIASFFGGRIYAEALNIFAIALIVLSAQGILNTGWNLGLSIVAGVGLIALAVATLVRSQFRRGGHWLGYVILFIENTFNGAGLVIAFILLWTNSTELELVDYALWFSAEVLDVVNLSVNLVLGRRPSHRNVRANRGYAKVLTVLGALKAGALLIWVILGQMGASETAADVSIGIVAGFIVFALGVSIFRRFSAYSNERTSFTPSPERDGVEMGSVESAMTMRATVSRGR